MQRHVLILPPHRQATRRAQRSGTRHRAPAGLHDRFHV